MSFMASKFAGLFRRGAKQIELAEPGDGEPAPFVRRADAHPDASPRAPLVVSRDLPGEVSPLVDEEPRGPIVEDITGLSMPRAPEPMPWEAIENEMHRLLENVRLTAPDEMEQDVAPSEDIHSAPTIRELTARLERGMARRRADGVVPERSQPEAILPTLSEMAEKDEAQNDAVPLDLEAALAALRGMTAKAG